MNIYRLLNIYTKIKSTRIKALGLLTMHLLHWRYTCLFFDPILACNLRCRMCYFSDPERRKDIHGHFTSEDINTIAKNIFPHLRKLQIGCGAEPTLHKNLEDIIKLGKKFHVPYISITTNGNLLDYDKLSVLIEAGLNEITLSVHGMTQEIYEYFMPGAEFAHIKQLITDLKKIKAKYPSFKIRINYTINERNINDLTQFETFFEGLTIDTLQLRPIQKIGESAYSNFSMEKVLNLYDSIITPLVNLCSQQGTRCLYPTKQNIQNLHLGVSENETESSNIVIDMIPHFYIAPWPNWQEKYNPYQEDFYKYCQRTKRVQLLLKEIFHPSKAKKEDVTKSMNYHVK